MYFLRVKLYRIVVLVLLFVLLCSHAELSVSEVHKCLRNKDIYFFGNSVARGTYNALVKILAHTDRDEHWESNITSFGQHFLVLHNRHVEKDACPIFKSHKETLNGTTFPHSCDEVYYNSTTTPINVMYMYWQDIYSKSLDSIYDFLLKRTSISTRENVIIFNAGLNDIINRFKQHSSQNCFLSHVERKTLIDKQIDEFFDWAERMTGVSDFTFRSTTPANASPGANDKKYMCWGKECWHMNQLIKIVNDKMLEVYQHNNHTRVNYLDAWKTLGGYCPSEICDEKGPMHCYTSLHADYDDWYHSSYLAYFQIAPWLENLCQSQKRGVVSPGGARGTYIY